MDMLNNATGFNQHLSGAQLKQDQHRLSSLQREYMDPSGKDHQKLKQAAQEFEGIFVKQLLDAMDATVDRSDSILSGGSAEEYFRGMMNEEIANAISTRSGGSGFGLAESIYRQLADQIKATPLAPSESLKMGDTDPLKPTVDQEG